MVTLTCVPVQPNLILGVAAAFCEFSPPAIHLPGNTLALHLADVSSEFIFIELYNELCSGCLQEVKNYKDFYRLLNENNPLKDKVVMMGIGVGSKRRKVAKFRKENNILFPLFADEHGEIFKCLGNPTMPTAYLVQKQPDGSRKIVLVQPGHIGNVDKLMQKITVAVTEGTD